ncbi:hypothetical protein B0T17DRAFT_621069 [Bombardia bombarda]|uniref:FAD-binding domain-containing protein n=1 Tax=Bombardia bombarda TaxID=252184 RepID=A0AA39WCN3_9PEZI|nr:hypothetical protein B0T17DRAFT_621069 [Bombardia bombarda]
MAALEEKTSQQDTMTFIRSIQDTYQKADSFYNAVQDTSVRTRTRPINQSLGIFNSLTIFGGGFISLGVLGFLIFLWTGRGTDGGLTATPLWRWIVLGQYIVPTITLSSVLLRLANASQAAVCTSLGASILLEKNGVPLSQVAEVSVLRGINDGPLRLVWLLVTSPRRAAASQTALMMLLLVGSIAIQFSSTMLVSDLQLSRLVQNPTEQLMGIDQNDQNFDALSQFNVFASKPNIMLFGEVPSNMTAAPNSLGLSDTGIVKRIFLPMTPDSQLNLRRFDGVAFVMNSRFACMRPVLKDPVVKVTTTGSFVRFFGNGTNQDISYSLRMGGEIDHASTMKNAGIDFPDDCPGGTCLPARYNCSLPFTINTSNRFSSSMCMPGLLQAVRRLSEDWTMAKGPVASFSLVYLMTRINRTTGEWGDTGSTWRLDDDDLEPSNEWISYRTADRGNMDFTICYEQLTIDRATVSMSTNTDIVPPALAFNATSKDVQTLPLRQQLGAANDSQPRNGLFQVDSYSNVSRTLTTSFIAVQLTLNSFAFTKNLTIVTSGGKGTTTLPLHNDYTSVFTDIMGTVDCPALALQAMMTMLTSSMLADMLPKLDQQQTAATVYSVSESTPVRFTGLIAVTVVVIFNLMCVALITTLFLLRTRYSYPGNVWQAVAHLSMSDETQSLLEESGEATDGAVSKRLKNNDPCVKVDRSLTAGGFCVAVVIYHTPGGMLIVEDTPETPCIRANRGRLRQLLSTGVDIRWDKKAARIEESDDKVTVFFEDGTLASGDLLVGADGTFSAGRFQQSSLSAPTSWEKPTKRLLEAYPSLVLAGETTLSGAEMEEQLRLGHSAYIAFGPDYTLFSGINRVHDDGKSADFYWVMAQNDATVGQPDHWVMTATKGDKFERAKRNAQALKPEFRVTIEKGGVQGMKSAKMWYDASITKVPPVNRVVLIGDAAHPMTPARGEGAIFAIKDAVQLGKVIASSDRTDLISLRTALDEYQKDILEKGYESILLGRDTLPKARTGAERPKAWGHEMRPLAELKPLPIKIAE